MNTTKTAITLALTAALGSAGVAHASENPFGLQTLDQGCQVAEADTKTSEGKCGANKSATNAKAKDGKCGESKCGANKGKAAEANQE